MKFNKWTLGLATVGAVSMASAVRADEAKMSMVNTALSSTTLSGYVDAGVQYMAGNQSSASTLPVGVPNIDGFSLNDVDIALDKPLDATAWSSGYHIEFNTGADAVGTAGYGANGVRQAYVTLNTPVGNGIQWKIGVQDDIIGYEGNTDGSNPNYTRSYGYAIEPTTLNGLIGSYSFCSEITLQAGLVNATSGPGTLSSKTFVGALALTAPDSWGFLKGGTLNLGVLVNDDKNGTYNYYAGLTIPTPCNKLKVGASLDVVSANDKTRNGFGGNPDNNSGEVVGLYSTFAATDKLSFNLRGEYFNLGQAPTFGVYHGLLDQFDNPNRGEEVTATVSYALWANVTSRAEFRWDHSEHDKVFGYGASASDYANSYILAVNLIYAF